MTQSIEQIQKDMKRRMRDEAVAQAMVTTSISLGLLLIPGVGVILSTIYSVLTLPGSLYVKRRTQQLIAETEARIRRAAWAAEDEVQKKHRAITEQLWDSAVQAAYSEAPNSVFEAPLEGLGLFKNIKKLFKKPVEAIKRAPKEISRAPKTIIQAIKKPDDTLRAAARSIERQVRPIYRPLEKPVGTVWKSIIRAGTTITTLPTRLSGHAALFAAQGAAILTGNKKLAKKTEEARKKWDRLVQEKINKQMEKPLTSMQGFIHAARKTLQYATGTAGLDVVKEKLAQIERQTVETLEAQKRAALARLDLPEARQEIFNKLVLAIRGELGEEYLATLAKIKELYDENKITYNPPPPDPTFFEILAAGWEELLEILGLSTPQSLPEQATRQASLAHTLLPRAEHR